MADLVSLGSAGCTASESRVIFSNFSFGGTLNSVPLDPHSIPVSFRDDVVNNWPFVAFDADIAAPPTPFDFQAEFAYSLAVDPLGPVQIQRVGSGATTYGQDSQGTFTYTIARDICEGGTFEPNCGGAEFLNHQGDQWFFWGPTTSFVSVRTRVRWASTADNFLLRFNGFGLLLDPLIVPEPDTKVAGLIFAVVVAIQTRRRA